MKFVLLTTLLFSTAAMAANGTSSVNDLTYKAGQSLVIKGTAAKSLFDSIKDNPEDFMSESLENGSTVLIIYKNDLSCTEITKKNKKSYSCEIILENGKAQTPARG